MDSPVKRVRSTVDGERDRKRSRLPSKDDFCVHFENVLEESTVQLLQIGSVDKERTTVTYPSAGVASFSRWMNSSLNDDGYPSSSVDLEKEHVRTVLVRSIQSGGGPSQWQKDVFGILNCYVDLFYPNRLASNDSELTEILCVHALNHVLKTRNRVLHHNSKLKEYRELGNAEDSDFRDQGLVRPKVLILVPFRNSAFLLIEKMITLLFGGSEGSREYVTNKKRFLSEFKPEGPPPISWSEKPNDFQLVFRGNIDDCFRVGVSVAKKSLKLFVDFYSADIIIASPMGLRMIVGAEGEASSEFDFLSAIEVLILDQADVLFMQNWQQVLHVLDAVNRKPKEQHGTDYSRVRLWALNEWTKYYRQTILFSQLALPEFRSLFGKFCHNYAGLVQFAPSILPSGCMSKIVVDLPQVFQRFSCRNPAEESDERFRFFLGRILPQYVENSMRHTLIYVASYYDYVRLRNHFKKETVSFVQLCEYSKNKKISRARDLFFHGKKQFLLVSERFHFYRRYTIRGSHHLIFYQLPTYERFYHEFCNMTKESIELEPGLMPTCTVLFSKYDAFRLNRVVGEEGAKSMMGSETQIHVISKQKLG